MLEVEDLAVTFTFAQAAEQSTRAVDGVELRGGPGRDVGLVGESGCGKSVTSLAIMGLLPKRGVQVTGSVRFDGDDLLGARRPARCATCAGATWRWSSRTRCPR